jgi:ATP-dependent helicase/nuclease subunit B
MSLQLVVGPANAGKVALLLDRYLEVLERDPLLVVPNRPDVERAQRDLLTRVPALLGGSIGTFDDLFERIAAGDPNRRPVATDAQRLLLVRSAVASVQLDGLARSAGSGGFAESLISALGELESALLDPGQLDGDLGRLYTAYRDELEAHGLWDRDLLRARAALRMQNDLDAWRGQPVFAYGFEDLTASEWALLEGLAGRTDVTLSLPYEPSRAAFASLQTTVEDLARLAAGRIEELPPRYGEYAPLALAHLERCLFEDTHPAPVPLEGTIRILEGAGVRGSLELVADSVLELIRSGTAPELIAVVCPSLDRYRLPLETVFSTCGVPYSLEARIPLARTRFGQALLALVRFAWLGGGREDLYGFLRSPYSGIPRREVDFAEGRLRGNAITALGRVEEQTEKLRGARLPALDRLRSAESQLQALREVAAGMVESAYGLTEPPAAEQPRSDLRCHESVVRLLDELEQWQADGRQLTREDLAAALERAPVRLGTPGEQGRVAVLDLMRARTRQFEAVYVLGLEEGSLPRRGHASPFLDDETRTRLGARLARPDPAARDRYLFYTVCTRATRRLTLVREAATEDGARREPSPFLEEVRALFDPEDVARWTTRRPLSALTWQLEEAPTERERVRAVAVLHGADAEAAAGVAGANGWERRLQRARDAFDRPTGLRNPLVLEQLAGRRTFGVTELERVADCSSAWFVDRLLDPRTIDPEVDAKLRGLVAHQALYKFFTGLPKELGAERLESERVEDGVRLMRRCLDEALAGVRMDMSEMQRRELEQTLWRDLEAVVRQEAASELPLEPRRFEVLFGSDRAAPELQRGLDLGDGLALSGKIDRIDVDPFSARALVVDYKSGKSAHSAAQIEQELRLQVPLYMLVLRDLVGMEPLGGVYRPLGGDRRMRGLLRKDADLPGFVSSDVLDDDELWERVERAREQARVLARRIGAGDVRHDPKGGECPSWCDLWPMCRVSRA